MRDKHDTQTIDLPLRGFRLEFVSDGRPYRWAGLAYNEAGAERLARHCLAVEEPGFSEAGARLVACTENR